LIFIDADMGWQANDLVRLASYDRDVVGASYPLKQGLEDYPCRFLGGELWTDEEGLMEVQWLPTGFLKIQRHVLEGLAERSRKFVLRGSDDREPIAEIFNRDVVAGGRISGDYNFCRKWGGKVFVDPEMKMEHVGDKTWNGSLGSYLRRKNGLSLSRGIQLIRDGKETASDIIELTEDWGNIPYAAGAELVKASIDLARQVESVSEVGSGLTSLAMAAAGAKVECLEHDKFWHQTVTSTAERLGLDLTIHYRPLEKGWYSGDLPKADMILCDGPPRTLGDREILFEKMNGPKCVIFDDAPEVTDRMKEWGGDKYRFETLGKVKQFTIARQHGDQS
jgi:hypothetical protein